MVDGAGRPVDVDDGGGEPGGSGALRRLRREGGEVPAGGCPQGREGRSGRVARHARARPAASASRNGGRPPGPPGPARPLRPKTPPARTRTRTRCRARMPDAAEHPTRHRRPPPHPDPRDWPPGHLHQRPQTRHPAPKTDAAERPTRHPWHQWIPGPRGCRLVGHRRRTAPVSVRERGASEGSAGAGCGCCPSVGAECGSGSPVGRSRGPGASRAAAPTGRGASGSAAARTVPRPVGGAVALRRDPGAGGTGRRLRCPALSQPAPHGRGRRWRGRLPQVVPRLTLPGRGLAPEHLVGLRDVDRARRRGEPVVQGVARGRGPGVVGGVVVQLPPPVVLVTCGPLPLLAHALDCPPYGPVENGASAKSGGVFRRERRVRRRVG